MPTRLELELGCHLTTEESKAVNVIGVFDQGRRLIVQGHSSNTAYVYDTSSDPITPVSFNDMLRKSLGKEWKRIIKDFKMIEKFNASGTDITALKWYEVGVQNNIQFDIEWKVSGHGLFAF